MKKFLPLILFFFTHTLIAQVNVEYLSQVNYPDDIGNDVWGYVAPDGKEYAMFGTFEGLSIVDISDPRLPIEIEFINQQGSSWRDIKTWKNFAYVTSDQPGTTNGLLIVDLSSLPDSVTYRNLNLDIPAEGKINQCHNLFIDENGYLFLSGCSNLNSGGLIILDVDTTPGDPIYVGKGNDEYSHDVYVRDNLAYSSEIEVGHFAIYDVTDKENIILLATQLTPFRFAHNAWLSDDNNVLFTTDELPNASIASYDISDLNEIKLLDEFRPQSTLGTGVIPHNVHVFQNWLVISYYSDGLIIVDATKPDNLVEVGNYDTFEFPLTGFNGAWGAYPYFPSGNIIIGDIGSPDPDGSNQAAKLFVLGPDYVRASYLEGAVTEVGSGAQINNAQINIESLGISVNSNASGAFKTGTPEEGDFLVTVSAFGYMPVSRIVTFQRGEVSLEDFQLESLARISREYHFVDGATNLGIENFKFRLKTAGFSHEYETDENGVIFIDDLIPANYTEAGGLWGYENYFLENVEIENDGILINVELMPGYEDNFELDLGWKVDFQGLQGSWELGEPEGVLAQGAPIYIAPEVDSPDEGDICFVTGNTGSLESGLLFGTATLTSPIFDATTLINPAISYYSWIWVSSFNGTIASEPFEIFLSNGLETVRIDSIEFKYLQIFNGQIPNEWNLSDSILIKEYLEPTENMQLIARISEQGFNSAVEGGFDGFKVFDVGISSSQNLSFDLKTKVYPNPTSTQFNLELEDVLNTSDKVLNIYSVQGKLVETIQISKGMSSTAFGEDYLKGIYFVELVADQSKQKIQRVIKL